MSYQTLRRARFARIRNAAIRRGYIPSRMQRNLGSISPLRTQRGRRNDSSATAAVTTEQLFTITTALSTSTGLTQSTDVRQGTQITKVFLKLISAVALPTGKYRFALYKNPGGLIITSTTPMADYLSVTAPPTKDQILIRQNMLCFREYYARSTDTKVDKVTLTCDMHKLGRLGLMHLNDTLVLVIQTPTAAVATFDRYIRIFSKQPYGTY